MLSDDEQYARFVDDGSEPPCASCESATGGVCREHAQPECICYEAFAGHMPGCPMAKRAPDDTCPHGDVPFACEQCAADAHAAIDDVEGDEAKP